jgi:hypothetical protein
MDPTAPPARSTSTNGIAQAPTIESLERIYGPLRASSSGVQYNLPAQPSGTPLSPPPAVPTAESPFRLSEYESSPVWMASNPRAPVFYDDPRRHSLASADIDTDSDNDDEDLVWVRQDIKSTGQTSHGLHGSDARSIGRQIYQRDHGDVASIGRQVFARANDDTRSIGRQVYAGPGDDAKSIGRQVYARTGDDTRSISRHIYVSSNADAKSTGRQRYVSRYDDDISIDNEPAFNYRNRPPSPYRQNYGSSRSRTEALGLRDQEEDDAAKVLRDQELERRLREEEVRKNLVMKMKQDMQMNLAAMNRMKEGTKLEESSRT